MRSHAIVVIDARLATLTTGCIVCVCFAPDPVNEFSRDAFTSSPWESHQRSLHWISKTWNAYDANLRNSALFLLQKKAIVPKKIPSRNNSQVERAQARLFRLFRFIKLKDKFPSFSTAKAASFSACSRCSPDPLELNELGRARTSTTPFTPRTPLTNSLPFAPTHARTCPRG